MAMQIRWIAWLTFIGHNRTVWSLLPVARMCPSGLNATALMKLVWPVKGSPSSQTPAHRSVRARKVALSRSFRRGLSP